MGKSESSHIKFTDQPQSYKQTKMNKALNDSAITLVTTAGSDSDTSSISSASTSSWADVDVVQPHSGYKKVLVTGGAGFIGSNVAEYLLERGDDVVIIDELNDYYDVSIKQTNLRLLTEKYGEERVVVYNGDICDSKLMEELFEKERP